MIFVRPLLPFLAALVIATCSPHPARLKVPASLSASAPELFQARFTTTQGDFIIEVHRHWAPKGADRFYNLVRGGFYDQARFHRVVEKYVQWGLPPDPTVAAAWRNTGIADEPVRQSNLRGFVAFAAAGPDTRTTQVFINRIDNPNLDRLGFAPFGQVAAGFDVLAKLHAGYGEGPPRGTGPNQAKIREEGETYLARDFPKLDRILTARIVRSTWKLR